MSIDGIMGSQDRISLYQNYAEEIRFLKKQQWSLTNYSSLVQAAIIAYYNYLEKVSSLERWILFIIALFIATVGTKILCNIQSDLLKNRKRMKKIMDSFPYDIDYFGRKWKEKKTSYWYQFLGFVLPFSLILWGGAFLVTWFLFRCDLLKVLVFFITFIGSNVGFNLYYLYLPTRKET